MKWTKRKTSKPLFFTSRGTSIGAVAIVWSVQLDTPEIIRILLPTGDYSVEETMKKIIASTISSSCMEIDTLLNTIEAFLEGENIHLPLDTICFDRCSPFQQKVLRAVYAIPRGRVSTYQLISQQLNIPRGARAAGQALATNPFPLVIPCHRVIRSNGCLGGFGAGVKIKRRLLEMEGVVVYNNTDSVKTRDFFCQNQ